MTHEAENVLVAHPDPDIRKRLCNELAALGCNTWPVADGWEAMRTLQYFPADLVLIHGRCKAINGAELTLALRNRPGTRNIATVILVHEDDAEMFWIAQQSGADRIVSSTDPEELREEIGRIVANRRLLSAA